MIINLTPHEITLFGGEEEIIIARIPPSGQVARVSTRATKKDSVIIDGKIVPIVITEFGEVTGLPEPSSDKIFVVSLMVVQAAKERKDLIAPDTTPDSVVRDEENRIVGVRRFSRGSE